MLGVGQILTRCSLVILTWLGVVEALNATAYGEAAFALFQAKPLPWTKNEANKLTPGDLVTFAGLLAPGILTTAVVVSCFIHNNESVIVCPVCNNKPLFHLMQRVAAGFVTRLKGRTLNVDGNDLAKQFCDRLQQQFAAPTST